ncbi:MAG TPA: hypothetical protein VHW09_25560 [Bryobacteraceae bacterium]|jgi:hypothetical protein|nr:hypothetical protein [Bryobacteraceae bacterium]
MPIAKRLTIENVNLDDDCELDALDDRTIAAGMERVRAEGDELRRKGMLDGHGKLQGNSLPPDMKEDAERDFGG